MTRSHRQFARVVEPHFEALYRTAVRLLRRRQDAEDLVQDVCVRAFEHLGELAAADEPRAWLMRVQYRLFVDGARRRARAPFASLPLADDSLVSDEPGPDEAAAGLEALERLARAWHALTREQRALLALNAEGYKPAEIARIAGISGNAASARLHRARCRLGQMLRRAPLADAAVTPLEHRL